MIRQRSKVVQIPASSTIAQMQTALDNAMAGGWELKFIFPLGANTYAVFIRVEAK
jgi:hypothetical protein